MRKLGKNFKGPKKKKKIDKVKELFGANTEKFLDLIPATKKPFSYFYEVAFGPFFYPIGRDGNRNPLVQIAAGKYKGKIGLIEHRTYYSGMSKCVDKGMCELIGKQIGESANELIEHCVAAGYMQIFEETFGVYFERRLAGIEDQIKRILEVYNFD